MSSFATPVHAKRFVVQRRCATIQWHCLNQIRSVVGCSTGIQLFIFIGLLRTFHPAIGTNDGQTPSSHDQDLMRAILLGDWLPANEKLEMGTRIFLRDKD